MKASVSVSLDVELLDKANEQGMNLSSFCNEVLKTRLLMIRVSSRPTARTIKINGLINLLISENKHLINASAIAERAYRTELIRLKLLTDDSDNLNITKIDSPPVEPEIRVKFIM